MFTDLIDCFEILQTNGCRMTAARKAVIETMQRNMFALAPVEVYGEARKQCPWLGLVSVYRTIEKLERLGWVQRVHQIKGCPGIY
jgi:Fur family transcriptional regulator, ferric uptake regulator